MEAERLKSSRNKPRMMRKGIFGLIVCSVIATSGRAQDVPVFTVERDESSIRFYVKASVAIEGIFDKWDASITLTSPDVRTAVVNVKIQADSVNTGSNMKDGKLKGKDFFNVKEAPFITFVSNKITQTGPETLGVIGDFTIRGVTKPEQLEFTISGKGTGSGELNGTMAFDRKDYGMNKGIPFIKIADRVQVNVSLKGKRVSGPPVVFQQ